MVEKDEKMAGDFGGLENLEDDLESKVRDSLNPGIRRLCETWREIGFDRKSVAGRVDAMATHLTKFLEELAVEEEEMKVKIEKKTEQAAREIVIICKELQIAPYEPPENATLFQLVSLLPVEHKKLKQEKIERMENVQSLLNTDDALAARLGLGAISLEIDRHAVPSREDLINAESHIRGLKQETQERQNEFSTLKRRIVQLLDDVGVSPDVTFKGDILAADEDSFELTEKSMSGLRKYCDDLEHVRTERRIIIEGLRSQFVQLWERLGFEEDEKQKILNENLRCRERVIDNFKAQVARLEELRIANLGCFTSKIRGEIRELWDQCYFSEEQKNAFPQIEDLNFTEPLLDQHEEEVTRLRKFYQSHIKLFLLVENWTELWEQFMEFEKRANDPNRFSKRGGGLLQEEKERKKFSTRLPKVEKELEEEISNWEKDNDSEFLLDGMKYMDYIKQVQQKYELEKQQEKDMRLKKRNEETKAELAYGSKPKPKTPTKRRLGTEKPSSATTQVKTPTKRLKGEELTLPRSATYTKSPAPCNGTPSDTNGESGVKETVESQTKSIPKSQLLPPVSGRVLPASSKRIPVLSARKRILSAANSDDALNGNATPSYQDFKLGVTSTHRSSSMTDLRNLATSGVLGSSENNHKDGTPLHTKPFQEANF